MQAEYRKENADTYLWVLQEKEEVSGYLEKMLQYNPGEGRLECRKRQENGREFYCYHITGKKALNGVYAMKPIGEKQIREILRRIFKIVDDAKDYLLEENDFVLLPEYIFTTIPQMEVELCYVPGYGIPLKEQLEAKGEEVKFTEQPYVPAQPLGEVVDEIAQESSDKYSNEEINPYTEEKEEFTNNYQFEYESDQSDSYGSEDDNDSYSSENSYSQETSIQENDDLTFKPSSNYWEDDEESVQEEPVSSESSDEGEDEGDVYKPSSNYWEDDEEELQEEPLSNDDSDDDNEDEGGSYEPISNYWEDEEEDFNSLDEELDEDEDSFDEGETSNAKISTVQVESNKPKKKAGRPRKVVTEPVAPKRRVGRPKKENKEPEVKEVKRGRGRPKKVEAPVEVKKGRGRPRKVEAVVESESKKKPGRPKKTAEVVAPKKKAGRPKKEVAEPVAKKKPVGRPKKEDKPVEVKKGRGRPKKEVKPVETKKKGRGRPKKNSGEDEGVNQVKPDDIDAYLKEIDEQIAKENAKIKESARQIERKSRRIPKK